MTPEVCSLCPVYSVILFWSLSLQKTPLHKDRMLEMEAGFQCFLAISGYSALILIQNTGRVVVWNKLLRPLSFAISSSWSSSSTDRLDSPGLFTNGSRIHSFAVRGSFVVGNTAQTLLKAKTGERRDERLDISGHFSKSNIFQTLIINKIFFYSIFLCDPVPSDPRTGTGPRPGGWGPLV